MNKANVFLLVVVSSLLTYISTAIQPAATAGVAQEKWEYFEAKEKVLQVAGTTALLNMLPVGTCSYFRKDGAVDHEVEIGLHKGVDFSLPSKSFSTSDEANDYLLEVTGRLTELSGQYGWHVFQVDKQEDTFSGFDTVTHWRRRIQ